LEPLIVAHYLSEHQRKIVTGKGFVEKVDLGREQCQDNCCLEDKVTVIEGGILIVMEHGWGLFDNEIDEYQDDDEIAEVVQ
jgi:hypothetical protein